ncbi:MAG: WYL domain-containing protein [Anaerolineales bacterium]|nr:WYL domain-containing protein [Anaerolineales bacterium]
MNNNWNEDRDNQIRRTARVLEIIQQIATAPGHWSRRSLAEHHEIGERMIQKDLEIIRYRLGLQLTHDGIGYSFERLPHLPTSTYSFSEAIALLTAARTAQALPGINSSELAAAIARLESIFPDELRPMLREATEQLPRRAVREHRQAMLSLLHRAFAEKRQITILYATASRKGEAKARTIEPYHLMPYGRSWQLIAFDHNRQEILQFKVDRVLEAEMLDTHYTIPETFDLDAYLGDGWGLMRGSAKEAEEISLLFDELAGQWVAEEYWHKSQQPAEFLPDGRVRMRFFVGITPEMVSWLLYYGERVAVEQPEWLRAEVKNAHLRAGQ